MFLHFISGFSAYTQFLCLQLNVMSLDDKDACGITATKSDSTQNLTF